MGFGSGGISSGALRERRWKGPFIQRLNRPEFEEDLLLSWGDFEVVELGDEGRERKKVLTREFGRGRWSVSEEAVTGKTSWVGLLSVECGKEVVVEGDCVKGEGDRSALGRKNM